MVVVVTTTAREKRMTAASGKRTWRTSERRWPSDDVTQQQRVGFSAFRLRCLGGGGGGYVCEAVHPSGHFRKREL
ncbi:unnamed protein product [Macrosiphum euphorbiae]|uniref:Uncharacterized protein n=1 Tax=Macrosiphum euphorbiae TaxID=13131 RepID=A0AAV0WZR0_9HEMI|nr:unnamed protein product [Macrosiphum euphorbiae]